MLKLSGYCEEDVGVVSHSTALSLFSIGAQFCAAAEPKLKLRLCFNGRRTRIPLPLHHLLCCSGLRCQGYYEFDVDVAFYEIFDEIITDLLQPDSLVRTVVQGESRYRKRGFLFATSATQNESTNPRLVQRSVR